LNWNRITGDFIVLRTKNLKQKIQNSTVKKNSDKRHKYTPQEQLGQTSKTKTP